MNEALKQAHLAEQKDEVPVGAVIVNNNRIIATAHNLTETLNDVTAHAEMQAFTSASNYLGSKYLLDCILYVTLEPCLMCAGASYWTQIDKIVFGAYDKKRGFLRFSNQILHPKTKYQGGVHEEKCQDILRDFFKNKR